MPKSTPFKRAMANLVGPTFILLALIDFPMVSYLSTFGYDSKWRTYLGLSAKEYSLGNSTFEFVLISLLREIFCLYFILSKIRPNKLASDFDPSKFAKTVIFLTVFISLVKGTAREVGFDGPSGSKLKAGWFWSNVLFSVCSVSVEFTLSKILTDQSNFPMIGRRDRSLLESEVALLENQIGNNEADRQNGSNEPKSDYSVGFRDLLELAKPDAKLIFVAFTALLIAAGGQVMIPHYTGLMIASILNGGKEADFKPAVVKLIIAAVICAVFSGLRGGLFSLFGARVNSRIRNNLFQSLLRQEIGFFDVNQSGEITSRLSGDCTKVGDQVSLNINYFLRNFVQAFGTLLFMLYLSWRLSLVAFVSVPFVAVMSKVYGEYIKKISKSVQDKLAEANAVASQTLGNMTTVKSFAGENREKNAYSSLLLNFYQLSKKEALAYGLYASTTKLLPQLVSVLVLFVGGNMVLKGNLAGSSVVSFMLYLSTLNDSFDSMSSIFSSMIEAVGAAHKVYEWINREPKKRRPLLPVIPSSIKGEICLEDVHFTYPGRPLQKVLKGMSIKVAPGEFFALVGPSGGGKSSCIALLKNFYHPDKGKVLLDGVPVEEYDDEWYHKVVSIVSQDPILFGRTIRENILYGLEGRLTEPTEEEIVSAAILANAHDFIVSLPDQYETQVGERGVQMSGGQKQRIAIARALVRKPKVLLLDEATSALDAESEHLVQGAIDKMILSGGMTVIIIAHRLSTVKNANSIAVVKDGAVVEVGSHRSLLERGGIYANLVSRQLHSQ